MISARGGGGGGEDFLGIKLFAGIRNKSTENGSKLEKKGKTLQKKDQTSRKKVQNSQSSRQPSPLVAAPGGPVTFRIMYSLYLITGELNRPLKMALIYGSFVVV